MESGLQSAFVLRKAHMQQLNFEHYAVLKEKIYANSKSALRKATQVRKDFYCGDYPAAIWIEAKTDREKPCVENEFVLEIYK